MKESESPAPERVKKAFCAVCSGLRNCDVKGNVAEHSSDQYVWANTEWFLLQCRGCENIFCQTVKTFSEDYRHEWDDEVQQDTIVYDETIAFFPAVSARRRPDWFDSLVFGWQGPTALHEAMSEMYVALDHDLMRLSAAGIRTAFDIAAEHLGVDPKKTFKEKLDELVSDDRINGVDRERLNTLTQAGHASIHRGWIPSASNLATMVEILEHFVHKAFVEPTIQRRLKEKSDLLKVAVPSRSSRKKQ